MTLTVAHIYASNAKHNSGDFMLGIATKKYFKEVILATQDDIQFTNFDCRKTDLYKPVNIEKLNDYDYILVGGGGLILPDTLWQLAISSTRTTPKPRGYLPMWKRRVDSVIPTTSSRQVSSALTKLQRLASGLSTALQMGLFTGRISLHMGRGIWISITPLVLRLR